MEDLRILQVRGVPPGLYQELRLESVRKRVPLNKLLQELWDAYRREQPEQSVAA